MRSRIPAAVPLHRIRNNLAIPLVASEDVGRTSGGIAVAIRLLGETVNTARTGRFNGLLGRTLMLAVGLLFATAAPGQAQDRLCDPGDENCRAILINYIRNETVGIDVAFWFMEDARYTD